MKIRFACCALILVLTPHLFAQRLPEGAIPEHYQLTFTPDFTTNTFAGEEVIDLKLTKPGNSVTLNAAEIKFNSVSVEVGGASIPAKAFFDPDREMATINVDRPLKPGPAKLHVSFTGTLNDKLHGFYLSKSGNRKYAVTQFEPTDARRAFPSFDEPDKKATFDITIVADKGDTAISNTRIESDKPGPGANKHSIKFSTTPKMSTYLVALLVGDFQCVDGSSDGIPIRACSVPGKQELGRFALEAAEHFLHFYNEYFGIKYPFQKLDMIALPDFEAGAMENVGAITYRETLLLIDDKHASVRAHRLVAEVVAHEMAHQWFGDLVTMKWWDNLWLNEGFASWMENKPVAAWKPEWNLGMLEVADTNETLALDSLRNTRPIRSKADTYDEINEQFDGIAYGKAAAVLRMVESYVGPEVFRQGVNNYLRSHAYGNATAEDFWNAITAVSKKPIDKVMSSFVTQPGVPMISLSQEGNTASVVQERFFSDRQMLGSPQTQLWTLPVCLRQLQDGDKRASQQQQCVLLSGKQQSGPLAGGSGVLFANAGAQGYYRTDYDAASRKALAKVAETALSPAERISLLGDEWAMAQLGRESAGDYMELIEGLQNDRTRPVLREVLDRVKYLGEFIVPEAEQSAFQAWVRSLLRPIYADVSRDNAASDEVRELRADIFETLGTWGADPEIIAQARQLTSQYIKDPDSVDASLARGALTVAARHGDAALFDQFTRQLSAAKTPEQYSRLLYALTSFSDPVLIRRSLEFSISGEVRNQDTAGFLGAIMENPFTKKVAWDFLRSHWERVASLTSAGSGSRIVRAARTFCDPDMAQQVRQFFAVHKVAASERTLKQTLERINNCSEFKSLQQSNLSSWLANHGQKQVGGK